MSAVEEASPPLPPAPVDARTLADRLGDEIAEADALATSASHATLTKLRRFIQEGLYGEHNMGSPPQWCSWRLGWAPATAKTKVRVALRLGELPLIDDAYRRGVISYSIVRALVRVATPETEAALLQYARDATGSLCAKIVSNIVNLLRTTERPHLDDLLEVSFRKQDDSTVKMESICLAEDAHKIIKALDLRVSRDREAAQRARPAAPPETTAVTEPLPAPSAEPLEAPAPIGGTTDGDDDRAAVSTLMREADAVASMELPIQPLELPTDDVPDPESRHLALEESRRRAAEHRLARYQAFVGIFEDYIENNRPARALPGAVDALVIVDHATLASADRFPIGRCELSDGTPISPETARRLTCDSPVSAVIIAPDGTPLDVGRRTRQINAALWKALVLRDRHCTFPGCERGGALINAHHIQHWARGGETNLDNLTLTCRGHHRAVHEGGYSVLRLDANTVIYFDPRGEPVIACRPEVRGDALELLRERARAQGIVIDRPVTAKTNALCEADLSATVGYILESTPGSRWYRPRPGVA